MEEKRMKLRAYLLALSLIAIANFTLAQSGKEPNATKASITAFVNVNVIPMDRERVIENQTVIVRDGRIAEIGPANKIKVPDGATRIDGAGKYLMPGLAEMHGHIPQQNAPKAYTEAVLFLYVANGITTVRGMLGASNQFELRDRANRGEIVAPTLYLAGPSFNGNSVNSPEQAVSMVRQQKQEGWDLLKVHPGLTRDEYDAMAKTAKEVGIRFAGHVPADVGIIHALEMGQETIDHVDGYIEYLNGDAGPVDEAKLADVVRRTKAAGAWIVPTMALWETLIGYTDLNTLAAMPELKYAPPQQVEQWKTAHRNRVNQPNFDRKKTKFIATNRIRILKALNEGGVRILLGTDAPQQFSVPGFSIHREMALMVKCGFTPYQIIHSGTKNVGDYFKSKDNFGTIEVGKRADLILVEGNPLKDVANISRRAGVMARGRWLPESEIRRKLDEIAVSWRTQ
jgi:imidazolonepropionase-like amidohydrolase